MKAEPDQFVDGLEEPVDDDLGECLVLAGCGDKFTDAGESTCLREEIEEVVDRDLG